MSKGPAGEELEEPLLSPRQHGRCAEASPTPCSVAWPREASTFAKWTLGSQRCWALGTPAGWAVLQHVSVASQGRDLVVEVRLGNETGFLNAGLPTVC